MRDLDGLEVDHLADLNQAALEVAGSDLYSFVSSVVFYPEYILFMLLFFFIFSQGSNLQYINVLF